VCGTHETSQEIGDVGHPTFSCRYRKPVIDLPTRDRESAARDDKVLHSIFVLPRFLFQRPVVGERSARVGDYSSHDRKERLRFWQVGGGNLENVL
jgi:hypothetical protein